VPTSAPAIARTDAVVTEIGAGVVRLLHLVSPALPVGAYAWSHGLESAVEQGWLGDEGTVRDWVLGLLEHVLGTTDAPILYRLHAAWTHTDHTAVERWNGLQRALRETEELAAEDCQMGRALARLLGDLGLVAAAPWAERDDTAYPTVFALAAARWDISAPQAIAGYLWSWAENQVAAAARAVPLGQTAGQRILVEAGARIETITARAAAVADEGIGSIAPGFAVVSALHEHQYSRLFRS